MKTSPVTGQAKRPGTTLAAFVVGLPIAAVILCAIHLGPWKDTIIRRYVTHPAQWAVVALFGCALGTLLGKLWNHLRECQVFRVLGLPTWDGKILPASGAANLLLALDRLSARLRRTMLAQRVTAVLDFINQRKSTAGLDDQMRVLADNDALALENSYSLTRFITWAMPILGFLGTVLGITGAIANISPEILEKSLSGVTGGLAEAFDSTALALGLTMVTMFCSFLVERTEQGLLDDVDRYMDVNFAHRFQRSETEVTATPQAQGLIEVAEKLVQTQAELWATTFAEKERQSAELLSHQQDRLAAALETAMERTLAVHAQRLAALEKQTIEQSANLVEQIPLVAKVVRDTAQDQQAGLTRLGEMMANQAATLMQIQAGEKQLIQLQTTLHDNLAALAGTGAFEQAVHNLTAAVHLLTSRVLPLQVGAVPQQQPALRGNSGKAA